MKVSELIEELRKMSQDAEVKVGVVTWNSSTPDDRRLAMVTQAADMADDLVNVEELEDGICLLWTEY